jgi:hypothetical protein
MRRRSILRFSAIAACSAFVVPAITAQNSIRIFDPVNVRACRRHRIRIKRSHFQ